MNEPDVEPERPARPRPAQPAAPRGARRFGWDGRDPTPGARREGHGLVGTGMASSTYPVYRIPGSVARITRRDDAAEVAIGAAVKALPLVIVAALVLVSSSSSAVDFTLRPVSTTATTVTFTWKRQPGAEDGYAFLRNGVTVARTLDPSQTTATFWKGSRYAVDVLHLSGGERVTRGARAVFTATRNKSSSTNRKPRAARLVFVPAPSPVFGSSRRTDAEDRYLRLEAATGRRRLPVPSEREDRVPDVRPLALAGHLLEGFSLRGRGAPSDAGETGDRAQEREGVRHVTGRAHAHDAVEARLRAGQEDRLPASTRRPNETGGHVRVEAPAGGRRLPVHSEREGRLPDIRPHRDAGHILEGRKIRRRGASTDCRKALDRTDAGTRVHGLVPAGQDRYSETEDRRSGVRAARHDGPAQQATGVVVAVVAGGNSAARLDPAQRFDAAGRVDARAGLHPVPR